MDSVLKNIVVCLLVVVPFPWTMQISLESQFVYHTSEKRYRLIIPIFQDILSLSMLLLWSREEIYQILTVSVKLYAENLLLLWMCVLHFYVIFQTNFLKHFHTMEITTCNSIQSLSGLCIMI